MLDTDTKRRIDNARDILVGKLPDPKSQVEQITIALIYKFMDDMDKQSEELGGKVKFFSGEYKKYAWSKIFDPRVSGIEMVNLYGEAIQRMNHNPNIPQLFRDIFKNAYLPYRDPETLKSFLKAINDFQYDHSERLGDAFEYLLSVLGSQGEAGQFRTPRHIIDFMVEIVDPAKTETILDPACGTAGFLISSYKHILKRNSKNYDSENDRKAFELHGVNLEEITVNNKKYRGEKLTSDDKERLANNVLGYDISPDMVRLSLVNMYLHGFSHPRIYEYDTLTSEDKWNEFADVILANPPFMSPYGGIKPHKRFSVESKRSEVLFVDYIAEHLTPQGRSCVIVPEGIIFQAQTAYKNLRKMLIEKNYLVGVVSLPAGVFNPYSNVKTSILWIDKNLAKKTNKILFVKIDNDGFDLGAQRRPIKENDMPEAFRTIAVYKESLVIGKKFNADKWRNVSAVEKKEIAQDGQYHLSADRYKEESVITTKFPLVSVEEVIEKVIYSNKVKSSEFKDKGKYPIIDQSEKFIAGYWDDSRDVFKIKKPVVLFGDHTRIFKYVDFDFVLGADGIKILQPDGKLIPKFFYYLLNRIDLPNLGYSRHYKELKDKKIPIPPVSVQEKIVTEIETKQEAIRHAKEVIKNLEREREYFGEIFRGLECEWVEVEKAPFEIIDGDRGVNYPKQNEFLDKGHCLFLNAKNVRKDGFCFTETMFITEDKDNKMGKGKLQKRDVILTSRGTVGNVAIFDDSVPFTDMRINSGMLIFRPDETRILSEYLFYFFQSSNAKEQIKKILSGSAQPQLPIRDLNHLKIPLPSLEVQKQTVEQLRKEQSVIDANTRLIEMFEQKIKDRIAKAWDQK
jgi:type I restriction enzyme M protein